MKMGLLDLSIVTDELITRLKTALGVGFSVTGNAPDASRDDGSSHVSLFLFHTAPSPYMRNTPVVGDRTKVLTNKFQPLALDLYYLLSAYAKGDYAQEQLAMTRAMKCLHENALTRDVVLAADGRPKAEFTVTMETQSLDEMSRLWQAASVPMRLSAVYRVSVAFLEPEEDGLLPVKKVETVNVDAEILTLP